MRLRCASCPLSHIQPWASHLFWFLFDVWCLSAPAHVPCSCREAHSQISFERSRPTRADAPEWRCWRAAKAGGPFPVHNSADSNPAARRCARPAAPRRLLRHRPVVNLRAHSPACLPGAAVPLPNLAHCAPSLADETRTEKQPCSMHDMGAKWLPMAIGAKGIANCHCV